MPARVRSIVLALTIAFAACNSARANEPNSPAVAPPGKHDVHSFVPAGMKVVESARGDLTGAGHSDALLVISPPSSANEKLGEGAPRAVLLLTQDAAGSLQKVAENRRIVPCARCGGLAGDPYAFSRIEKGQFTISISGGSRERWADDYTFRYAADRNTWFLYKVTRELTDTQTEQHKALELTPRDFGQIAFADFDPTELPRIEPPTEHRSTETN